MMLNTLLKFDIFSGGGKLCYEWMLSMREHETYQCPRCRSTLPLMDGQTTCPECPALTDEEIPELFSEKVKIISITQKKLKFRVFSKELLNNS